jgi:hypothetical protein
VPVDGRIHLHEFGHALPGHSCGAAAKYHPTRCAALPAYRMQNMV